MSQATQEIADLDFSLLNDGQTIVLRRVATDVTCYAFVRDLNETQLVDTLGQQEYNVIISPTQIYAANWPAAPDSPVASPDPRIPIKGDSVFIAGRKKTVQAVLPKFVADTLVRIDMKVMG
jgi:hypothetical protein